MASRYCIYCGSAVSFDARFCSDCGREFLNRPNNSQKRLVIFGTAEQLMMTGSFVALAGAILGVITTIYIVDAHGFSPVNATLLIISLPGFASFIFSALGLILMARKKR